MDWLNWLEEQQNRGNWYKIFKRRMNIERKRYVIYPDREKIYRPFELAHNKEKPKVIILGDEPASGPLEADGVPFSGSVIRHRQTIYLYRKIEDDLGISIDRSNGDLSRWYSRGIFLMNKELTVRAGKKNSHQDIGWWRITLRSVERLFLDPDPKVFLLLGVRAARTKGMWAPEGDRNHLIIKGGNPEGRSFFFRPHFRNCNNFIKKHYGCEIDWS